MDQNVSYIGVEINPRIVYNRVKMFLKHMFDQKYLM